MSRRLIWLGMLLPVPSLAVDFYTQDFESTPLPGWTPTMTTSYPATTRFAGRYGNDTLTFDAGTRDAGTYCLEIDLYLFDSWDGGGVQYGPDRFIMAYNGTDLFNNLMTGLCNSATCSYDVLPGEITRGHFGGSASWQDSIIRGVSIALEHPGGPMTYTFRGTGLQALNDESWGVDNVRLSDDPGVWYVDEDGDGFGGAQSYVRCTPPAGLVDNNLDCDDSDDSLNPAADEICDGIDNNCDGEIDNDAVDATLWYADVDGDGFGDPADAVFSCTQPLGYVPNDDDCNDGDNAINPNAAEVCDGVDNDCSGEADDGLIFATWYEDADGDSFGNAAVSVSTCDGAPTGYVADNTDCDDTDDSIFPGAPEIVGDGIDQDCSGTDTVVCYVDLDRDGYGTTAVDVPTGVCENADQLAAVPGDCDDSNAAINPSASEVCDGVDNNCSGSIDDGLTFADYWPDADGDSFGDATATAVSTCDGPPLGHVSNNTDCDDTDDTIYPGATEIPNDGIDQDCNGDDLVGCYEDLDQDTYGSSIQVFEPSGQCLTANFQSARSGDCDDTNASINPSAVEVCDGVDNNCSGQIDDGLVFDDYWPDFDEDGFGDASATPMSTCDGPLTGYVDNGDDCDDDAFDVNPDATEICDGIDNNCSGEIDDGLTFAPAWPDLDDDGFGDPNGESVLTCDGPPSGYADNDDDCDDTDASIYPGANEVPGDGIDQDCDGSDLIGCYRDDDGDTYGTFEIVLQSDGECLTSRGEAYRSGDCDDTNPAVNPGAVEICDGIDNDCDGQIDNDLPFGAYWPDLDGDGFGDAEATPVFTCDGPPAGMVPNGDDCDDDDDTIYPGAPEIPGDGIDQDCDGVDEPLPGETGDTGETGLADTDTDDTDTDDTDTDDTDDTDTDTTDTDILTGGDGVYQGGGCSCDVNPTLGFGWFALLALPLLRRRRA